MLRGRASASSWCRAASGATDGASHDAMGDITPGVTRDAMHDATGVLRLVQAGAGVMPRL